MGLRGSVSQEWVKLSIDKTSLKYIYILLNFFQHLPGASELRSYWFLVDWRPLATTWRRSCSNWTTHGRMGIPTGLVLHDQPNGQHQPPRKNRWSSHSASDTEGCSIPLSNPTMHLSHIPQCTTPNRNAHISVLNGALWDVGQVHCVICGFGVLLVVLALAFCFWHTSHHNAISGVYCTWEDLCDRSRYQWHGQVITSHRYWGMQ